MTSVNLTGKYLLTHKNHIFNKQPEIFLILQDENALWGFCVNAIAFVVRDNDEADCMNYVDIGKQHTGQFAESLQGYPNNYVFNSNFLDDRLFVIHTGIDKETDGKEYQKGFYYLTDVGHFIDRVNTLKKQPGLFCIVQGCQQLNINRITDEMMQGNWEIRSGSHAMTYGNLFFKKYEFIDILKPYKPTNEMIGSFDAGGFANQFKKFFEDITPTMMAGITRVHYAEIDKLDLNEEEMQEAIRMAIALSERENEDVAKVMERYTHQERVKKYKELIDGGINLRLLASYDRKKEFLDAMGMNAALYDTVTLMAMMDSGFNGNIAASQQKQRPKPSAKADNLERKMSGIGRILKMGRSVLKGGKV